jgi:hypothetical protein
MPVGRVRLIPRLHQDPEDASVAEAGRLRQQLADRGLQRGQPRVLDERALVEVVAGHRLEALGLRVARARERARLAAGEPQAREQRGRDDPLEDLRCVWALYLALSLAVSFESSGIFSQNICSIWFPSGTR